MNVLEKSISIRFDENLLSRVQVVKDLMNKNLSFRWISHKGKISLSTLLRYCMQVGLEKLEQDLQKLMSEMIRLANIIESRNKEHIKQIDAVMQINAKPQPDKNIWDWWKELRK